jgi:hypothetical protein
VKTNWQLPIANCQFRKSGQATLESCLVIALLAFVLFGILQVARLAVARETLDYAAVAAARARTVGFNDFMIHKVVRVANIPNAGRMETPNLVRDTGGGWGDLTPGEAWDVALRATPGSPQYELERSRIPLYLAAENGGQLPAILEYENWDDLRHSVGVPADQMIEASTRQELPITLPFHRAYYADDEITLEGAATLEDHASLYLE